MAYWAGSGGSLMHIDYSVCRVGVIQYFLKHSIKFLGNSTPQFSLLSGSRDIHIFIILESLLLYYQHCLNLAMFVHTCQCNE